MPGSRCGFGVGVASEAPSWFPHNSSPPQKRPQELQNQKSTDQVDRKYADDTIAAELFCDPAAGRCDELRPCDRKVCERRWSDDRTRLANDSNRFVCGLSGHTDYIVPRGAFRS